MEAVPAGREGSEAENVIPPVRQFVELLEPRAQDGSASLFDWTVTWSCATRKHAIAGVDSGKKHDTRQDRLPLCCGSKILHSPPFFSYEDKGGSSAGAQSGQGRAVPSRVHRRPLIVRTAAYADQRGKWGYGVGWDALAA